MKWWLVFTEETSGRDCDGHSMPHLVCAATKEQAISLFTFDPYWQEKPNAVEFSLPDISRKRKPFVFTFSHGE